MRVLEFLRSDLGGLKLGLALGLARRKGGSVVSNPTSQILTDESTNNLTDESLNNLESSGA